jgi:hypothetical protein
MQAEEPSIDSVVDRLLDHYERFVLPERLDQRPPPRSTFIRWLDVLRLATFRRAAQFGSAGLKLDRSFAVLARAGSVVLASQAIKDLEEQLLLLDLRMGGPVGDARTFRQACRELVVAATGQPASAVAESAVVTYQRLAETDDRADVVETEREQQQLQREVEQLRVAYRDAWLEWIDQQHRP